MLALRPNCEYCDKDLPPDSQEARICSYECTFCSGCVEGHLKNVCPNCGGGFQVRPIRPAHAWRPGVSREHQEPATERRNLKYPKDNIAALVERLCNIQPHER